MKKTNLIGLTVSELEAFVTGLGEPKYRAAQMFSWLNKFGVRTFDEMTNLPLAFREKCAEAGEIIFPVLATEQRSAVDGTRKFLFRLEDGLSIESVSIPPREDAVDAEKRQTLCISTQIGCPLDCRFCATATMGYLRNLTAGEIVGQVMAVQQQSADKPVTNIVFMGMGEPMLNYDNVMKAIEVLTAHTGLAFSPRRITISTAGYASMIRRMADEDRKPKLALSLHSLRDDVRRELMPITKKFSVSELLSALEYYTKKTKKSVMLEYILFEGVNDTAADVSLLIKAARRIDCRVNLIPFHSIAFVHPHGIGAELKGALREEIDLFASKLRAADIPVFVRNSAGVDIDAACGQLAVKSERAKKKS
ncbi:MAG TPA: 23S rRNA (adenine(2503)-C(2))-methyltransferase RlmN [Bacteroidota bacterium]|nr:23S rRNA (adenine(2503)-C(2))-methyltransferase RlmN [Bacteroidota bacterium]